LDNIFWLKLQIKSPTAAVQVFLPRFRCCYGCCLGDALECQTPFRRLAGWSGDRTSDLSIINFFGQLLSHRMQPAAAAEAATEAKATVSVANNVSAGNIRR